MNLSQGAGSLPLMCQSHKTQKKKNPKNLDFISPIVQARLDFNKFFLASRLLVCILAEKHVVNPGTSQEDKVKEAARSWL